VDVINQARKVASDVVSAIKNFFRISSPSKLMMEVGEFLDKGLAEGISSASGAPVGSMSDLSEDVTDAFTPKLSMDALRTGSFAATTASAPLEMVSRTATQARPLTVVLELNRQVLGKAVYQLNNEETQRVGVQLAGGYGL
jgi:hypothetical protein